MLQKDDDDLGDDLIWGVDGPDGIAAFLKIPPQRAYYMIAKGVLPVRKHSHRIITASRKELRRHFSSTTSESAA